MLRRSLLPWTLLAIAACGTGSSGKGSPPPDGGAGDADATSADGPHGTPDAHAKDATAVPLDEPFCAVTGTVHACDFGKANGYVARLVWDAQFGPGSVPEASTPALCSTYPEPLVCGTTSYAVPSQLGKDWLDVGGGSHAYQPTVTIGANPILLEGG
jgi:hypothetical protein